jgi:hypothetical protein
MLNKTFSGKIQDKFKTEWSKMDPDATGFIAIDQFETFLFNLEGPIGWDEKAYRNNSKRQEFFMGLLTLDKYNMDLYYEFY